MGKKKSNPPKKIEDPPKELPVKSEEIVEQNKQDVVELTAGEKKLLRQLEKEKREEEELRKLEENRINAEKNKSKKKNKNPSSGKSETEDSNISVKNERDKTSSNIEKNSKNESVIKKFRGETSSRHDLESKPRHENVDSDFKFQFNKDAIDDHKDRSNSNYKSSSYSRPNNTYDRSYNRVQSENFKDTNYRCAEDSFNNRHSNRERSDSYNKSSDYSRQNDSYNRSNREQSDYNYKDSSYNRSNNRQQSDNYKGSSSRRSNDYDHSNRERSDNYKRQDNYYGSDESSEPYNRNGYNDKEFKDFIKTLSNQQVDFTGKINEKIGDLFEVTEDYSLAHCVAEDLSMGAGIAVEFRYRFRKIDELCNQNVKEGGVAILKDKQRYVYYLITKQRSSGKPTLYTLWKSLKAMRDHIRNNNVRKLAMPQIGCGLDRLNWPEVKAMLEYIFQSEDIEIDIYSLSNEMIESKGKQRKGTALIKHQLYPLIDIVSGTALLYFGSEDHYVSPEIESLDTKYPNLISEYRRERKIVGNVIRTVIKNEVLYGLIIKRTRSEKLDFTKLDECCKALRNILKKDEYEYVGIQAMYDPNDSMLFDKMLNIMSTNLWKYSLYICWPKELHDIAQWYMPSSTSYN